MLLIAVSILGFMAGFYKVEEAQTKEFFRHKFGLGFSFLSTKAYMQFLLFLFISPLLLVVDWDMPVALLLISLSLLRFVPWVIVNVFRGRYKNTKHQASSNFTMLENFAGPIGALLVYGIFNYFYSTNVSIIWYLITPFIGFFLLWALRDEEGKLSREMIIIIALQALLVAAETSIIFYLQTQTVTFVTIPLFMSDWLFVDNKMIAFMVVIAISSFLSALFFLKDIIGDAKKGIGIQSVRIGFVSAVHDVGYFISFMYFGPIFVIARRGMLIPMQNLYIGLKKGDSLAGLMSAPFRKPLLSLNGGKDFIISFVDVVFNRIIQVVLTKIL